MVSTVNVMAAGLHGRDKNSIMNDVSNDKFAPDTKLTRGMIVTILYRLEGESDVSVADAFSNIPTDAY